MSVVIVAVVVCLVCMPLVQNAAETFDPNGRIPTESLNGVSASTPVAISADYDRRQLRPIRLWGTQRSKREHAEGQ